MKSPQPPNNSAANQTELAPGGMAAGRSSLGELRTTVAEVARVLHVRRWLFCVPLCLVISIAFIASLYVPRHYRATTAFERRDDPVLVNLPRNEGSGAFITFRRTLAQDVRSIDTAIEIVRDLGLAETTAAGGPNAGTGSQAPDEAAVRRIATRISSGLEVRFLQESEHLDLIEISYSATQPERMVDILNAARDKYIKATQQHITDVLFETKQWFEDEWKKRHAVVEALENDLIQFRTDHRGIDPLDVSSVQTKLSELRSNLADLGRKTKEFETQINGRQAFLDGGESFVTNTTPPNLGAYLVGNDKKESAESRRLAASLRRVTQEIDDLQTGRGMTDRHPRIMSLTRKRELLSEGLRRSAKDDEAGVSVNSVSDLSELIGLPDSEEYSRNPEHARAEMEISIYQKLADENNAEIGLVLAAIAEYEVIQREALLRRHEFTGHRAEVERANKELSLYQNSADKIGRVLAAENSQRGILFGKIKPASGGNIPASPRPLTVLVLALTVGLTTSVVLVIVAEVFDRTIRTRRQVTAALGLPVLESIGVIMTAATRRRAMMNRLVLVPAITITLLLAVLISGSMAFLSLRNRPLYERAIGIPKSFLENAVQITKALPSFLESRGKDQEHQG